MANILKQIKFGTDLDAVYVRKDDVDDKIKSSSINPVQNKVIYDSFKKVLKDGYIQVQTSCYIENDRPDDPTAGFYSLEAFNNGIVCGCLWQRPYFYDISADTFVKGNLTATSGAEGLSTLQQEQDALYMISGYNEYGNRFKYIYNDGDRVIAVNPDVDGTSSKRMKIYSSDDGINWTLQSVLSSQNSYTFKLYHNVIKTNGHYYTPRSKTMMKSDDLVNWTEGGTGTRTVEHICNVGNIIYGMNYNDASAKDWALTKYDATTDTVLSVISLGKPKDSAGNELSAAGAGADSTYADENVVVFGLYQSWIVYSRDGFETWKFVQIGGNDSNGDIRGITFKDDVYYAACYKSNKIYFSLDLDSWYQLGESVDYPKTEGLIEYDDDLWYVTRTDYETTNLKYKDPYLFRMSILNDRILKKVITSMKSAVNPVTASSQTLNQVFGQMYSN